jgi:nucleoside-diphosphate-sugar epimerase
MSELQALDLPFASLKGQTILISGANGFLPAYLVDFFMSLSQAGCRVNVIALCRNGEFAKARFQKYAGHENFRLVIADVCEQFDIQGPLDVVIHAASQASPKFYATDPVGTMLPNVLGTLRLLELCRNKGARQFLFFSSGEVYGALPREKIPTSEKELGSVNTLDVRSCYAESKRLGETMCVSWSHQFGLDTKILRVYHTYGPGMKLDDGRVFADFVRNLVTGEDLVMKSDGLAVRPFCYIADTIAGILHIMLKGKNAEAYNIGNDEALISIAGLADRLVETFAEKKLKVVRIARQEGATYLESPISINCPDTTKLRELGWSPRIGIEEGFKRTVRHYEFLGA